MAVASAIPSATAGEFASTIFSPGRCHLLLKCPVSPPQQNKEAQFPQRLHAPPVYDAPNPIITYFVWTSSSLCIVLSKWEAHWLLWHPSYLPCPSPQGTLQAATSQPVTVHGVYSPPNPDLALLAL